MHAPNGYQNPYSKSTCSNLGYDRDQVRCPAKSRNKLSSLLLVWNPTSSRGGNPSHGMPYWLPQPWNSPTERNTVLPIHGGGILCCGSPSTIHSSGIPPWLKRLCATPLSFSPAISGSSNSSHVEKTLYGRSKYRSALTRKSKRSFLSATAWIPVL